MLVLSPAKDMGQGVDPVGGYYFGSSPQELLIYVLIS